MIHLFELGERAPLGRDDIRLLNCMLSKWWDRTTRLFDLGAGRHGLLTNFGILSMAVSRSVYGTRFLGVMDVSRFNAYDVTGQAL